MTGQPEVHSFYVHIINARASIDPYSFKISFRIDLFAVEDFNIKLLQDISKSKDKIIKLQGELDRQRKLKNIFVGISGGEAARLALLILL